jgi:hypothetical protein
MADRDPIANRRRSLQWQIENRERRNARERERHKQHPEMHRTRNARRRARQRNLPDTFTTDQEAFMLNYWGYACAVCGNEEGFFWTLVADHFIPVTSPNCPGTVAHNLIPLCNGRRGCNNSKRHSVPGPWLERRVGKTKAAKILHAIATYFAEVHQRFPSLPNTSTDICQEAFVSIQKIKKPSLSKAERYALWAAANPEKKKANWDRWYAKNRDRVLANKRSRDAKNRDRINAEARARRAANPEKARDADRKYREKQRQKRQAINDKENLPLLI